jgi:hypothetical protein
MRYKFAVVVCAWLTVVGIARASSITYNFTGTANATLGASSPTSGPITGTFTVDSATNALQDFSFTLPQLGGLDPWTGTSYVATNANSNITVNDGADLQYQIEAYNTVAPYSTLTVLNLIFDSLPGAIHTGVGPASSLQQAPLTGGNWTFLSTITTGSATGGTGNTVPEPPTIVLLAGGLMLAGLSRRRLWRSL